MENSLFKPDLKWVSFFLDIFLHIFFLVDFHCYSLPILDIGLLPDVYLGSREE